jgi:hypothetical protein
MVFWFKRSYNYKYHLLRQFAKARVGVTPLGKEAYSTLRVFGPFP